MLGDQHVVKHRLGLPQADVLEGTRHAQLGDDVGRGRQNTVGEGELVPRLLLRLPRLQRLVLQGFLRREVGGVHLRVLALVGLLHLPGGVIADDALLVKGHAAIGGGVHAGDDVEGRGLTGAVGADQRHDLALVHLQVQVVHGHHAAELHGDIFHGQNVLTHLDATSFAAFSFFLNSFPKKLMIPSHENSRSPMMPLRKNSTTIMMTTENTSIRKPPRMKGMFTPR